MSEIGADWFKSAANTVLDRDVSSLPERSKSGPLSMPQ